MSALQDRLNAIASAGEAKSRIEDTDKYYTDTNMLCAIGRTLALVLERQERILDMLLKQRKMK